MTIKKAMMLSVLGAMAVGLTASKAHAGGVGYVCTTAYVGGSTSMGNNGYIQANFTSAPNCGGTFLESDFFCSSGASSSNCSQIKYSESALLATIQNLQRAAADQQKVNFVTGTSATGLVYIFYYSK